MALPSSVTRIAGQAGTFDVTFNQSPTATPTLTIYSNEARTTVAVATANLTATANPAVWTGAYPATLAAGTYYLTISAVYTVGQPATVDQDDTLILTTPGAVVVAQLDVITEDEAKAGLNIPLSDTSQDTELAQVITAASRWLDDLVGPVVTRAVTETHQKPSNPIYLRQPPALGVTSVTEYSSGTGTVLTAEAVSTAGGYLWNTNDHTVSRRSSFTDTDWTGQAVVIVYTAGRYTSTANVDPRFKDACVTILQYLWQQRGTSPQRAYDPETAQAYGGSTWSAKGVNTQVRQMLVDEWVPLGMA